MSWIKELRKEHAAREELTIDQLHSVFDLPPSISGDDLRAALKEFEYEYGIRIGLLRPDDSLQRFLNPPAQGNVFTQVITRLGASDRGGELSQQLAKRRKQIGLDEVPRRIPQNLREFVLAWTGSEGF